MRRRAKRSGGVESGEEAQESDPALIFFSTLPEKSEILLAEKQERRELSIYSGIPISGTSRGNANWFEKLGSSRNRRWHQIMLNWPDIVWPRVSVQILTKIHPF